MAADRRSGGLVRQLIVRDDLLLELIWGILLAALLAIPAQLLAPEWTGLLAGCLLAGVLIYWLVRLYGQKIWHYLAVSMLLLTGPVLLPLPIWPRLLLILLIVILAVRAFVLHFRSAENPATVSLGSAVAALVYLLVLNLLAVKLQLAVVSQAYYYLGIAYLMLTVWRWHQISLAERLLRFENMATQPIARIRRFNLFLLIGYTSLLLLVLLVSPWLHLQDLLPVLGQALLIALRWLIRLLTSLGGQDTPVETEPSQPAPTETGPGLPEAGATPAWLLILQEIIMYLFYIASAALLIALIIYGLYTFYKRFYANRQKSTDVLESLLPNLADQIKERLRRGDGRWTRQFGQSPEHRIRRLYYRLIEGQIRRGLGVEPAMTPRQIEAILQQNRGPVLAAAIHEMTGLYELARYGSDQCTADDAHRMHELCQLIRRQSGFRPAERADGPAEPTARPD